MKTAYGYSHTDLEKQGKWSIFLYLLIITAILAFMVFTEFGYKLYK
ncbi:MAG: hypothetical protein JSS63_02340 [Bacteroidetes bacterium]|nr:hypothetical protein [Bacteroidota bacterium]MBX7046669.1 hypothetical protein [Ignavibacteria bacterium]